MARLLPSVNQQIAMSTESLKSSYPYGYHKQITMLNHVFGNKFSLEMCAAWEPLRGGPKKKTEFIRFVTRERNNRTLAEFEDAAKTLEEEAGRSTSEYSDDMNINKAISEVLKSRSKIEQMKETDTAV